MEVRIKTDPQNYTDAELKALSLQAHANAQGETPNYYRMTK